MVLEPPPGEEADAAADADGTRMPQPGNGEVGVWAIEPVDLALLEISISDNLQGGSYVASAAAAAPIAPSASASAESSGGVKITPSGRGVIGPLQAVTLGAEARPKARIPATAKY